MLLELQDLQVFYGRIEAIKGISFSVDEGEIVTLIGANGAGKTTTLKTISGVRDIVGGKVVFEGRDITHVAAHKRVELGICQSPEGRGIFPGMTVLENLDMGAYARKGVKASERQSDLDRVFTLFPRLDRAQDAARRDHVRRRAADAGHRPGADGTAPGAAARRAVDGPGADAGAADLRHHHARSTTRARPSCWSSRTRPRPCRWPTGPTCCETGKVIRDDDAANLLHDEAVQKAYLGGDLT